MVDPVSAAGPASPAAARTAGVSPDGAARPPAANHHRSFREFLSELNPLQYIPVIGTLYRAITGDTIPEVAREVGSMVFSGLTGGPVGVAINVASLAVEKAIGIDPEKIGQSVLAGIGLGGSAPATRVAVASTAGVASPPSAVGGTALSASAGAMPVNGDVAASAVALAPVQATTAAFVPAAGLATAAGSATRAAYVTGAAFGPNAGDEQNAPDPAVVAWSPAQLTAYGVTTTSAGDLARGALQGSDVLNDLELARHRQVETA